MSVPIPRVHTTTPYNKGFLAVTYHVPWLPYFRLHTFHGGKLLDTSRGEALGGKTTGKERRTRKR